ncbi:MAG: hypothetical protein WBG70_21605, partial [Spirulinaceae cyanobacterium]
ILGKFASVVALLGSALYFTGWIYRWSYFGFFQLEVTTLNFPFESFLFVPLQVFLGSFAPNNLGKAILQTLFTIAVTLIIIQITVSLLQLISLTITATLNWLTQKLVERLQTWRNQKPFAYKTRSLINSILIKLNRHRFTPLKIRHTLFYELIIVLHIIIALFFLARHQGIVDARQDAGINSSLSAVTLVIPENKLGFGQKQSSLDQPTGLQIIGDRQRYEDIVKSPTNDPNNQRVWRIVIDQGGYFYIFRTLPPNASPEARPVILAVQGSLNGDQLWIFSPEPIPNQVKD